MIQGIVDESAKVDSFILSSNGSETGTPKYFDIISFDPRGVNHSTPLLNCFPDIYTRHKWTLQTDALGLIQKSQNSNFNQKWSRYVSRSETCIQRFREAGDDSIAYYMGTRSAVDDIVAITERHGEWRETTAKLLLSTSPPLGVQTRQQILKRAKWRRGEELVMYWGSSYGTVIGNTLASIYPHKIQRMVLDSVLSPSSFSNISLENNLHDADKILVEFARLCHAYGPGNCKFFRNSTQLILDEIEDMLLDLFMNPLAVPATLHKGSTTKPYSGVRGPDIVTWSDLKSLIVNSLYNPFHMFPILADILQDVSTKNGSSFARYKAALKLGDWLEESLVAISCGDGRVGATMSKDDFRRHWEFIRNQSVTIGDTWAQWDMMCAGWETRTKWRYNGPFTARTANPILFVGNRLDPVCPIGNAYDLVSAFPGSAVLEQNTVGHGILRTKSTCTENAIKSYFQSGRPSASRTVCEVDEEPFQSVRPRSKSNDILSFETRW